MYDAVLSMQMYVQVVTKTHCEIKIYFLKNVSVNVFPSSGGVPD